jgi:glycosyltransferase involved in cell wall biosynthesis
VSQPLLSILTPTIPQRAAQLRVLSEYIKQCVALCSGATGRVEHSALDDVPGERRLTVGEKRDRLMREARGKYVAFVDDDDAIAKEYIGALLEEMMYGNDPDVITFRQHSIVNGMEAIVEFRLGSPNEPFDGVAVGQPGNLPVIKRNAWHVCAWRRDLAILSQFPSRNYREDWAWAERLCLLHEQELAKGIEGKPLREAHIPRVLHFYRHDAKTTAAPAPVMA